MLLLKHLATNKLSRKGPSQWEISSIPHSKVLGRWWFARVSPARNMALAWCGKSKSCRTFPSSYQICREKVVTGEFLGSMHVHGFHISCHNNVDGRGHWSPSRRWQQSFFPLLQWQHLRRVWRQRTKGLGIWKSIIRLNTCYIHARKPENENPLDDRKQVWRRKSALSRRRSRLGMTQQRLTGILRFLSIYVSIKDSI